MSPRERSAGKRLRVEWPEQELDRGPMAFFARHPVFRFEEFAAANERAGRSRTATRSTLKYHVRTGRLVNLQRGLYCAAASPACDPWVLASKLTKDAVLAWDAALSFHGVTPLGHQMTIMTRDRIRYFVRDEVIYRSARPPKYLGSTMGTGIETVERAGEQLQVTTLERTLVDCLDRLDLGPGLEGLWRGFVKRRLDGEAVVSAAVERGSQTTAARVGLFLHFHPRASTPRSLDNLRALVPRRPVYAEPPRGDERLLGAWTLLVSGGLLDRMQADSRGR